MRTPALARSLMLAAVFLAGMIAVPAAYPGNAAAVSAPAPVERAAAPASVVPTLVATAIATAFAHTCAIVPGGGVDCWGYNDQGQLGDGTTVYRPIPVAVASPTLAATQVATGGGHTCALLATGGVECWGANEFAQLGDTTLTSRLSPGPVSGMTAAVAVSAGGLHTCAALTNGRVECWGYNEFAQLGDGAVHQSCGGNDCSTTPVEVDAITNAIAVSAGTSHTCALLASGGVACWGLNDYGQLGDNAAHQNCSGFDCSPTPVAVTGITTAVAVSANEQHTCALLASGGVKCWGNDLYGQLGDGTIGDGSPVPVAVSGITTAVSVSAGMLHTCAVLASGSVTCWGDNSAGQLGDGTTGVNSGLVVVSGITTAVAVAAGSRHTCALLEGGGVWCWGEPGNGIYDSSVPVQVLAPDTTAPTGGGAPSIVWASALPNGGTVTTTVLVPLSWPAATDAAPGWVVYELQTSANGGLTWTNRTPPNPSETTATVALPPSVNRVRVRASDLSGNKGAWFTRAVTVSLAQENAAAVHYHTGAFARVRFTGSSGGWVKYASAAGRSASYTASGRVFALVSTKAKARGKAKVYVNGVYQGTIDLYSASTQPGRVVWRKTFSTSGTRTIKVVLTGTKRAAATSKRVDIDAFVVLK